MDEDERPPASLGDDDLPSGWTVWNDEPGGQVILAYRPDVFEGEAYPAACLPTITVSQRHPDANPRSTEGSGWHVLLYLEPEVRVRDAEQSRPTRPEALAAARELAAAFDAGEVAYRDAYQMPRAEYLDRLDELTGGGETLSEE